MMYNRYVYGDEKSAVAKLFSSSTTRVETVLGHKGVPDYLQTFNDPATTPRAVLSFVEREMPVLLDYAKQIAVTSPAGGSLRGDGESLSHSQNSASSRPLSPATVSVNGAAGELDRTESSTSPSSSRPLLNGITGVTTIIRHPRRRLSGCSADGIGRLSSGSESEESQRKSGSAGAAVPADSTVDKTQASINATELLSAYISGTGSVEALRTIVPVSLVMLGSPCVDDAAVATSVQRLLLAAFEADFVVTTDVINATLDSTLVAGCVRSLSRCAIVVETIIALFGSALSAVVMMTPTTNTTLFTIGWIKNGFVDHLCAALPTVLRDPRLYNYFYFVKELLKRGFSHSAGPVVDILLSYERMAPVMSEVLQVAEGSPETVRLDDSYRTLQSPHLAGEGLAVWSYAVGMLRKSLPVTETREMYGCTCDYIAPVRLVRENASRLMAVLVANLPHPATQAECLPVEPSVTPCEYAGSVRLSICTLFVELAKYEVSQTDALLVNSGFIEAFLRVCRAFPRNDFLTRLLHSFVLNIFQREPLQGETVRDAVSRDALLSRIAEQEASHQNGLISSLVGFAKDPALVTLSLSTFAIDALTTIAKTPWCATATGDAALLAALQYFFEDEPVQLRLHAMIEPITGTSYRARGSAKLPAVVHHPTIDFAASQASRTLSLSVPGEDGLGVPEEEEETAADRPSASPPAHESGAGPYTVVPFVSAAAPEERPALEINLDDVHREMEALKECGSPQMQAYPNFASMQLMFVANDTDGETDENDKKEPVAEATTPPLPPAVGAAVPDAMNGTLPPASSPSDVPTIVARPDHVDSPAVPRPEPVRKKMPPGAGHRPLASLSATETSWGA